MRVVYAPAAQADLQEIADYIARDSIDSALRVLSEIELAVNRLAENPQLGPVRPDLAPTDSELRFWTIYSYLIAYRYDSDTLEVVRVLSGFRDLSDILA